MECVKRVGITNAMVVALDDETKQHVTTFGLPAVRFSMQVRLAFLLGHLHAGG